MTIDVKFVVILCVALLAISACTFEISSEEPAEELDIIEEVWEIIHTDYVDSEMLNDEELAEAAIRGMIGALDDPYTSYLGPQATEISSSDLEGDFSGIGATLTVRDRQLTVVAPIIGSPAELAGIKPGDIIVEVDGEATAEMSLMESVLKIRGKKGTMVNLLVLHIGDETPVQVEIIRAEIEVPSVEWEILVNEIAHITITSFTNHTGDEVETVLEDDDFQDISGIVLDLRGNPGGLVSSSVEVVSQFVAEGIVVYSRDNKGEKEEWDVIPGGSALDTPLVVLVNEYSASASEVVAGALQDHQRGLLIGMTTYGKGTMNLVNDLSNEGSLYITFARWFTPDGRQIDGEGITPDIEVDFTIDDIENDRDPQLERAIEHLKQDV